GARGHASAVSRDDASARLLATVVFAQTQAINLSQDWRHKHIAPQVSELSSCLRRRRPLCRTCHAVLSDVEQHHRGRRDKNNSDPEMQVAITVADGCVGEGANRYQQHCECTEDVRTPMALIASCAAVLAQPTDDQR